MADKLKEILGEFLDDALPDIKPDTVLTADLGLTSMDLFDLVNMIEERFNIAIPDKVLAKLVTVRDVVEYLETAA
jgi:acyl carrier protein